jgi:outer membrane lipoprotein-sorting protein
MSDMNTKPASDPLDKAVKVLRDQPVPPLPTLLEASTVEALQTNSATPEILRLRKRRELMLRIARYGSLAAAALVLIILGASFFLMDRNAGFAFGQVVQKVKDAKSVSFRCKQKIKADAPTLEQRWFMQGDGMRMEMPGKQEAFQVDEPIIMAYIGNLKQKRAIQLNFKDKVATLISLEDKMTKSFANPIDQLRTLKDQDAKREADEDLDGHKTHVYSLKRIDLFGGKGKTGDGDSFRVWVNPKTGLPVRIVIESLHSEKKDKMVLIFDEFVWNEPMAAEMFSVEVPKGFTEEAK